MDYNNKLAKAIDHLVLDEAEEAETAFQEVISALKKELADTKDRQRQVELNIWWARTLELMEEFEQALIRYQKALELDWSNREVIYCMANLFIHSLGKPKHALPLLTEKLLKWDPENEKYSDLLDQANSTFDENETEIIEID